MQLLNCYTVVRYYFLHRAWYLICGSNIQSRSHECNHCCVPSCCLLCTVSPSSQRALPKHNPGFPKLHCKQPPDEAGIYCETSTLLKCGNMWPRTHQTFRTRRGLRTARPRWGTLPRLPCLVIWIKVQNEVQNAIADSGEESVCESNSTT